MRMEELLGGEAAVYTGQLLASMAALACRHRGGVVWPQAGVISGEGKPLPLTHAEERVKRIYRVLSLTPSTP